MFYKFFFVLSFLLLTFSTMAIENKSLTVFLHGRDAAGIIIYDRLEIFPNLEVVWKTASKGPHCPDEAGTFKGKVTQETFDVIFKLALAVEGDKQATKEVQRPRNSREVSTGLTLESGGNIRALTISEQTQRVEALNEELAYLKSILSPGQAVQMKAMKISQGVRVTFTHLGQEPFRVLIPKAADEAFFLENKEKISFNDQPKARNVMLSNKRVSASYDIRTPPIKEADKNKKQLIFYSGAALAHHGDAASDGKLPRAQEVALCAEF